MNQELKNQTTGILVKRLNELDNISVEDQKENPALMISVSESIRVTAALLYIFCRD